MKTRILALLFGIFLLPLSVVSVWAQIKPIARFSKDTIQVGEPVTLSLSVQYDSKIRLLLPDTNYIFAPFELLKKEFFTTITKNGISRDSVVYVLSTFSLDSIQAIQVPVFQFTATDSTEWLSNPVQVRVNHLWKGPLPEKPQFISDVSSVPVPLKINYPYIIAGIALFLLLLVMANFFFNKPIQRFFYLFIEKRRHEAYIKQFDKISQQLNSNLTVDQIEKILTIWKKYIQKVDSKPYTTFTSAEIFKVLPDKNLRNALQEIDRWIYGGMEMENWMVNIERIKETSITLYQNKRESIKNGNFK